MFERFTERARKVMVLAQEETGRFGHNYIGTEHLLLGLVMEEEGVAAQALSSLNVALDEVREQVESVVGFGEGGDRSQVPFTPRSKKVLELALRESMQLGHNYIGTEHILLGLARESEGVAARVLSNLDVDPDKVRREVLQMLGEEPGSDPLESVAGAGEPAGNRMLFRGRVGALEVGARVGELDLTLLVDLDYAYAVRDTDRSTEAMDHTGLLDRVVGVLEGGDLGSVEAGIQESGMASLEHFPALREIEISATREHTLEGRAALDLTVTRTFRR
jgi:ATP-dependent Clp protease ATP-binding subunit ClpA